MIAAFIDAENFNRKKAPMLFQIISTLGSLQAGYIYGSKKILPHWQMYSSTYQLAQRLHKGGREAADNLLKKDMRSLCSQEHHCIVLAADDGGYAPLAEEVIHLGHIIYGVGSAQASKKLRSACTDFFVAGEQPTLRKKSNALQEETPPLTETFSPIVPLDQPLQASCAEQVDRLVHLPAYFGLFLGLFLHQTFHSLAEEDRSLVHLPEEYLTVLRAIASDPLFVDLLTGERKDQWQSVVTLAKRCEDAYQQGRQSVEEPFGRLLMEPQHFQFTGPLLHWYQRGHRDRGRELQVQARAIWRTV